MKLNFKIDLKYKFNNEVFCEKSEYLDYRLKVDEKSLVMELLPTKQVEILQCNIVFETKYNLNDKVFVNGYQSWSTSREYERHDKLNALTFLTRRKFALKYSTISGDYLFKKYPKTSGIFHSYTYTYIKTEKNNSCPIIDDKAGNIYLFGSRTEKQGFTIFNHNFNENSFIIEKEVEGLIIENSFKIFDIYFECGEYDTVFDNYFNSFIIKKTNINRLTGYTSWYNYFQKINEEIILRDLDGLSRVDANIFQIDDGYQKFVGEFTNVNLDKFPNGMKVIADKIHSKGLLAGLWLAPFSVQKKSSLYKQHKDWVLKDKKGKPILGCVAWNGAYTLDFYIPEVKQYIIDTFKTVIKVWGFNLVKLDFLYTQCMIPRRGKSRGMIMFEAMEFLRECVGEDILILGCGVPLGSAFNNVDLCRIGCDVDIFYKERFYLKNLNREIISTKNAINNTIFRRHLNKRAFINDPDVFFLRDNNINFNKDEKQILANVNNLFGDVLFVSDNIGDYDEGKINLLKETFKKNDVNIIDCNYVNNVIVIEYEKNGVKNNTIID